MQADDKELLIKKFEHLETVLRKSGVTQFYGFLSEEDYDSAVNFFSKRKIKFAKFGAIKNSERVFISVYEDVAPEEYEYPITVLKIQLSKNSKEQSHRNYLGSLLALGIERRVLGDIIISDKTAYVAIQLEFADFVKSELTKISNETCIVSELDFGIEIERKTEYKNVTVSVASNRLDAVISELTNMARDKAKELIIKGLVFIDGEVVCSPVKELKQGSKISVRKYGKFIFEEISGNTKSGRIRMNFKKYM